MKNENMFLNTGNELKINEFPYTFFKINSIQKIWLKRKKKKKR